MNKKRLLTLMGGKKKYWQNVIRTFNTSIIGFYPLWEATGTVANDISGNGRNGVYSAAGITYNQSGVIQGDKAPLFETGNINIYSDGLASAFNGKEGSIGFWYKPTNADVWTNDATGQIAYIFVDGSNRILLKVRDGVNNRIGCNYISGGTNNYIFTNGIDFTDWFHVWLSWSYSTSSIKIHFNGSRDSLLVSQTTADYTWTLSGEWAGVPISSGMYLAGVENPATLPLKGNLNHCVLLDRAITDDEAHTLHPFGLILFDGDSRTSGKSYPHDAFKASEKTSYTFKNQGTSGYSLPSMIANASTNVDAYYRNNGQKNICIIWGGVNAPGETVENLYSQLRTYCLARRAKGWKVIACTEIDAQDALRTPYDWTTKYQQLNTLIRADYSFADGLADLGANVNLQDATNTTYFDSSKVHLTTAGYTEVANIVAPVIAAL